MKSGNPFPPAFAMKRAPGCLGYWRPTQLGIINHKKNPFIKQPGIIKWPDAPNNLCIMNKKNPQ